MVPGYFWGVGTRVFSTLVPGYPGTRRGPNLPVGVGQTKNCPQLELPWCADAVPGDPVSTAAENCTIGKLSSNAFRIRNCDENPTQPRRVVGRPRRGIGIRKIRAFIPVQLRQFPTESQRKRRATIVRGLERVGTSTRAPRYLLLKTLRRDPSVRRAVSTFTSPSCFNIKKGLTCANMCEPLTF